MIKQEVVRILDNGQVVAYGALPRGERINRGIIRIDTNPMDISWGQYNDCPEGTVQGNTSTTISPTETDLFSYYTTVIFKAPKTLRAFRRFLKRNKANLVVGTIVRAISEFGGDDYLCSMRGRIG